MSIFDPEHQQTSIESRIAAALERIAEAFKALLWVENRKHGLSPIQTQILVFLLYHRPEQCTTTALAGEFNITKPTVSDALRVLVDKGLILRVPHPKDARKALLRLTTAGETTARDIAGFADAVHAGLLTLPDDRKELLLGSLLELIAHLQANGVISMTRMCLSCRFFTTNRSTGAPYCSLMQKPLAPSELRVDCPDFERR